jgi:hypothetical protein
MSPANCAGFFDQMHLFAYLLVVVLLLPAQGLCTMPTPPVQPARCLIASTRKTRMHTCTSMLCISNGQLRLSAGCSVCRMHGHRVCATWQHPGTGCRHVWTASTHEQACTSIYILCSAHCAVAAVCNLFWLLPYAQGLCSMSTQVQPAGLLDRRNTSNRCTDVCQHAVQLVRI